MPRRATAAPDRTLPWPRNMIKISGDLALIRLTADCKFPEERARRVLNIAWEFGEKAEPCPGGYVHVYYHPGPKGKAAIKDPVWSVVEHLGPAAVKEGLALSAEKDYTQRKQTQPSGASRARKDTEMARTAAAAKPATGRGRSRPAPEPEQNGDMNDEERGEAARRYLAKPFTPTMEDYVEWFETYVSPLSELRRDPARILVLGIQLYGLYFQKSPFNRERTAQRRAERAAGPAQEAPAPNGRGRGRKPAATATEPARPASRGRGRTAAAQDEAPKPAARRGRPPKAATETAKPATPARRGRPPKAAAETKPASTGRGRGRTQAAGKDAPF